MIQKRLGYFLLLWLLCLTRSFAQTTYPVQVNVHVLPPYSLYLSDYNSSTRDRLTVTLINRDQLKPSVDVRLRMTITAPGGVRIQTHPNAFTQPVTVETGSPLRLTQEDLAPYFLPANLTTQGFLAGGKLPEGMVEFCFQAVEAYTGQVLSASTCTRAWITSQKPPLLSLPRNVESIAFREPLNILFQWTPLHQGLANVEYDFILKELWDNGMTPQAAFPYSPEIHRETTRSSSIIYGALQPALLPGKTYAWCVRAKARDGIDEENLFQNDGYSEIRWFKLQDDCNAPQYVEATAERKRINLQWNTLPQYIGFTVNYRLKSTNGPSQNEWKELKTDEPTAILYGLQSGGTYEYRVANICMAGSPVYTDIFTITVPNSDSARLAQCGILPAVNLTNQEPLKTLKAAEEFKAGDFPVTVINVSGSNGNFTGKGFTIIPWLNDAKVAVEFKNININTDYQMTNGFVEAMYDKAEGQIGNLDEVFEGGFDVGNVKTGLTKVDYEFDFSIPGVEAFSLNDEGELVIMDSEGTPHTVTSQDKEGSGNEGNKVVVFPMTVQDKDGNVYKVEKVPVTEDGVTKEVAKATALGKVGQPLAAGSFDPTQLDGDKAIVTFTKGDGKYAFDTWEPYYDKISLIEDKYQKLFDNYYAPWKFVLDGQTDVINATIVIKDDKIKPENVIFKTPTGTEYKATRNGNNYIIEIASGPAGDVQELYALYPKEGGKYYTLGKIGIATYAAQNYEVVLVSVNGVPVDEAKIKQTLLEIYGPVGVTWRVSRDTLTYANYRLMENSTGLSTYNDAMRNLNNAYRSARPGFKENANYLFFLLATGNTDVNNRDLTGFMPRGAQFGYLFTSELRNDVEAATVAHELGHGRWKLYHPFDKHYGGFEEARVTNNVLAYGNGKHLAKWQWDQMNDPALMVSVFEKDDRSQMQGDPLLTLLQKRIADLEAKTKLKHFTIIHCDACENAGATNINNELKISDAKDVPSDGYFSELSKITIPDTKLTQVQFIERKGGKCIVLYYAHTKGNLSIGLSAESSASFLGVPAKKLYFVSESSAFNCTSFADALSNRICELKAEDAFTSSEQTISYYNSLFEVVNNCLLNTPKSGKILVESEIESFLKKAKSQVRPTQEVEFVQNGFVYRLDQNGKVSLIDNPLSNESINAGAWDDASVEMKMRLAYNAEGVIQFEALGIRKDLPIVAGKTADIAAIAQNMREKNNALFIKAKITSLEMTAKTNRTIINNDEFPDGKKVTVDEDASYFKLVAELGGVGISFLKSGKIEQPVYTESDAFTVKAPPIATGVLESVGMVVTDITSAVSTVHDIVTDEKARKEAIQGFVQIKDQVSDDPTQLFPILTEVIVEEFTGSTPDEFKEVNTAATDGGRKQHIVAKTGVRTATNVFASGKFLVKLPDMAKDVAFKMARSKSFLKFRKVPVPDEVLKNFEEKLKSLSDGGEKFLDDFKDVSDDVRKEILDNPDLVDEWKAINDAPPNPSKGGKPEWLRRLQEGNDFNKERSSFYTHNEIYVEKPGGKGYYRLDSYNPGKEIVSRKYTQLADIEEVTGAKYVQELKAKYPPGAKVANVPSNKAGGANKGLESSIGKGIVGDLVLEIPVQKAPIPQSVINEANKLLITIRDVNGKAYN